MKKSVLSGVLLAALIAAGCTHSAKEEKVSELKTSHEGQPQPEVWYPGTVDEAFAAAQKDKKLVFLYWGAVWCPPCNELKANVFSKPRFGELMTNFIPVYLDGDGEAAQVWGERLQASGYPTVLILNGDRQELYRLSTAVTMDEFDSVVQSLIGGSAPFDAAAEAVLSGKAQARDLQTLAYSSWDQLPQPKWTREKRLAVLDRAWASSQIPAEKSLFASAWINASLSGKEGKLDWKTLEPKVKTIFASKDSVWASREFIKTRAGSLLTASGLKGKPYESLKTQWIEAAALLRSHPLASVDTRLWSINPELEFYAYEHPQGPVSEELRKRVDGSVRRADAEARSEYERHAVISGAAYLLRQVGDFDKARALLEVEVKKTNTPWYYQSSLSALETQAKNPEAARKWSAAARQSVEGRASKVQWITSDVLLNAKDSETSAYLVEITREFYEQTLQLKDGFLGRNWARAKRVEEALGAHKKAASMQKLFKDYASQCSKQEAEGQKNCQQHFAALMG